MAAEWLWALLRFAVIASILGVAVLVIGARVPRRMDYRSFPYRTYPFEDKLYRRLRVSRWKTRLPDASRFSSLMMRKTIDGDITSGHIERLIRETCVAESSHWMIMILILGTLLGEEGDWTGWYVFVYDLFNLPFIITQRYNRPRMIRIMEMLQRREAGSGLNG